MSETIEKLSSEQVGQTLQFFDTFAQGFSKAGLLFPLTNRYYTPDMVNASLKTLNNNPMAPSNMEALTNALANPNDNEMLLRKWATYFEINNMLYKRLITFNANLPAWNITFDCINAEDYEAEVKSEEFKKDLKVVDNFLSKYYLKEQGRIILNQILRQGVFFGVFRDEGDFYVWQELPAEFCKITGNSNVGKLFDFNFSYFISKTGSNIDMFPKVFKKLYKQIYKNMDREYNPKGNIDTRHSSFVYWINVSPRDNFFCFTLDDGLNTLIPYYSSLFPDMYLQPMMRELEKNKAMIAGQKLLVNILETYDKAKSGQVPNQYAITPKDIGEFMALIKQALGETIKAVAIPAKTAEVVDFNVEAQNRYEKYQDNIAQNALASSASIMGEDKLNVFEAKIALDIDENFAKSFYSQMEKFLNYYVNSRTGKYKFKFKLQDTNTTPDKENRMKRFLDLAKVGLVDFNLYARALDSNIFEAKRALQFTKSMGLEELLMPLLSLNNQTKQGGRPTVANPENENTVASIEVGSNEMKD